MTEKFVENQVCRACEAMVRPGALFCYNCGSSVAPALAVETEDVKREGTTNFGFNGNVNNENNSPKYVGTVDQPIEKPLETPFAAPVEKKPAEDKNLSPQEQAKIKSPASLRQKSRNQEGKTVEVIWEAPGNSTNIWFIAVSLILVVFAAVILLVMLYIR